VPYKELAPVAVGILARAWTPGETEKIGKPTAVKTALTAWTIDRDVEDAKSASVKYVCKFKKHAKSVR